MIAGIVGMVTMNQVNTIQNAAATTRGGESAVNLIKLKIDRLFVTAKHVC